MTAIIKTETRRLVKSLSDDDFSSPNISALNTRISSIENAKANKNIIVGTSQEITDGFATHTIENWVIALQDNYTVLFLNGAHTQIRNEDITKSGINIVKESSAAIIDGSTFTFTVSGNENELNLRFDNMGDNELILSGDHNDFKGWFTNAGTTPISDTGNGNTFTEYLVS